MRWHRDKERGGYFSGPYRVVEVAEGWAVTGPGLATREDCLWDLKAAAQAKAFTALADRLGSDGARGTTCEVVQGDHVVIDDGRPGVISGVLHGGGHGTTYMVRLPRGRRLIMFRGEFKVVAPR